MRRGNPFEMADLQLVRAIGEAGTLSGAARRLSVDHSTAFRRLGLLEERLGVHLFERSRDGYRPTLAGEVALGTAARILDDLQELNQRLAGQDLRPSGTVRVTTADTLVSLLSPIIAALSREHPNIRIDLVIDNSFFTLTKRDADIAVRPIKIPPESLIGRRIGTIATAFYASTSYRSRLTRPLSLSKCDWIGFEDSLSHLQSSEWIRKNIDEERIRYRANSLMACWAAARSGIGIAALPCYLADPDDTLIRIHNPISDLDGSLYLLTHPDLRNVVRIRIVLDFLAKELSSRRGLMEGLAAKHKASKPGSPR